jgi:hypothetical protein
MANPVWYPNLAEANRRQLFAFTLAVLNQDRFAPREVNRYCGIEN